MSDTIQDAEFTSKQLTRTTHLPATMQDVKAVVDRMATIHALMREAMTVNVDYGVVPGTSSKPTLLKSGAEKICVMFNLCPRYRTEKHWDGPHLTVETTCIINGRDGVALGEASAMCSTRESKYAYRKAQRVCPACGKPSIVKTMKGRNPGGYWCVPDKGGCNANFNAGDKAVEGQQTGRVANEDLADSYNTVLRIAEKRAYIAAVRLVTGSSALFDEEIPDNTERPMHDDQEMPTTGSQKPAQAPQEPKTPAEPLKPSEPPAGLPYPSMTASQKLHFWIAAIEKSANLEVLDNQAKRFEGTPFDDVTKAYVRNFIAKKRRTLEDEPVGVPFRDPADEQADESAIPL